MKNHQHGFTLVEVMIFLAISGAMLGWSVLTIRGRQQQVQFSQAVRDFENNLKDYINDTATGYYSNATGVKCVVLNPSSTTSDITFQPAVGDTSGANKDCIFIGKAIQFSPQGTNGEGFNVFTVLGRRQYPEGSQLRDAKSFKEARPRPLLNATGLNTFDYTEHKQLSWGARITSASSGLLGFFTTFAQTNSQGLQSGSLDTQTIAIPSLAGSAFPVDATQAVAATAITDYRVDTPAAFTSQTICLARADNAETALVTIGVNGRNIDVHTEFKTC